MDFDIVPCKFSSEGLDLWIPTSIETGLSREKRDDGMGLRITRNGMMGRRDLRGELGMRVTKKDAQVDDVNSEIGNTNMVGLKTIRAIPSSVDSPQHYMANSHILRLRRADPDLTEGVDFLGPRRESVPRLFDYVARV